MTRRILTGQEVDWQNLPLYWQEVGRLVNVIDHIAERKASPTDLTARTFDEAQTAGHRVYMEASRYLSVAVDNHEALLALLPAHGATLWAPWSLIRPMFESSFLAAWVLDPEEGLERRRRALHLEVQDSKQQRHYLECFLQVPSVSRAVREQLALNERRSGRTYKDEAVALGVPWDRLGAAVSVFDGLPKLSAVASQDKETKAYLQATWRMLSGYEHGLMYAALKGSDRATMTNVPGGKSIQLTINDDAIVTALKSTYFLFLTAARLFERRRTRPD
jgi:hypothetical protein